MSALLLALIVIKGVCLFICWKTASKAKKQRQVQGNEKQALTMDNPEELQYLQRKMAELAEQNRSLTRELHELKQTDSMERSLYSDKKV